MTIPTSKQKKIITLAQQGLSIPDIAKKTSTSYKTAKKYADISTTPQPQIPAPQQSVIDGRSPKFATPKPKRARDTTRSYASYENVPYYRPVRIAPKRVHVRVADPRPPDGLDEPVHVPPVAQAPSENKYVKLFNEVHNQKGIDTRPIIRYLAEQKEREQDRQRMAEQKAEDDKKMQDMTEKLTRQIANDREHAKAVADIKQTLIENKRLRDRSIFELYPLEPNDWLTESGVRDAVKDAVNFDKEQQHKIAMAYGELRAIQNNEVYRVKKKQIDDKFWGDIALSVLGFVGNVVKSVIMVSSKPKIVKAQKPMQARVIK